jgi:hypothetical protein
MTNYLLFTPLIIDDEISQIIGPLLNGDLPKMLLVSKRLHALYKPSLHYTLKAPVNTRLEAAFAQAVGVLPRRVMFQRVDINDEELSLVYDLLLIGVLSPLTQAPRDPMVIGLVDVKPTSFIIKFCNFYCALEHMDTFQSRDVIPGYDDIGEDPQDRSENCYGDTPADVDDTTNDGINPHDRRHIERWLVLKLNGHRWLGVYTSYNAEDAENHNCMFAFRRTPKGAYSALLLVRDIISHYHLDICPPIPPLFRE